MSTRIPSASLPQGRHARVRLIGVASGLGAQDPGCGRGPWALKHSHWMHRLATAWSDLIYPRTGLDHWATLADLASRVGDEVVRAMALGDFPVVIGGDHTCALGTWSGVARGLAARGEAPAGLLWIDAHMDSHVPETSLSHAAHGMPLAALLGHGQHALVNLAGRSPVLRPEQVCLLAVRSYEEAEAALLQRLGVRVIAQAEVQRRGLAACLSEGLERVGSSGFGLSLDLDAIDPHEAPGVGSPEPAGLSAGQLIHALTPVLADPRLLAMEIAEYNPEHDPGQVTLRLVVELLERLVDLRQ